MCYVCLLHWLLVAMVIGNGRGEDGRGEAGDLEDVDQLVGPSEENADSVGVTSCTVLEQHSTQQH